MQIGQDLTMQVAEVVLEVLGQEQFQHFQLDHGQ